jgi:hypothetical protein
MSRFDDATAGCNVNALPLDVISEEEIERERDAERADVMHITCKDTAEDNRKYDFWTIQSSNAFKQAKEAGEYVVLPEDNQLLIDIDSPEAEAVYNKNKPKFEMHIAGIVTEERKPSRNGNTHIYVTLDRTIDAERRVLYQALLGSDQTRELLSFVRILNEDAHPTLFIEKPLLLLGDGNAGQPDEV